MNRAQVQLRLSFSILVLSFLLLQSASCLGIGTSSSDARPEPPINPTVRDRANDAGGAIEIKWEASFDDSKGRGVVTSYSVFRSKQPESGFAKIKTVEAGRGQYTYVDDAVQDGERYYYRIVAETGSEVFAEAGVVGPVVSSAQWFDTDRVNMLVVLLVVSAAVLFSIFRAQAGKELYVRPIAGLQAVDEAVGRATEMGRAVIYVPGIMDMDDIQTIAGIAILGRVARKTADYETQLIVPVSRSVVMSSAQETVKEAYYSAGRPDAYHPDRVGYLTDDQFGFAAGVDGMILREKPAAIFLQGCFYAESLILAETGHAAGAIQIAGTAMPSQLPFFVTACDYTLIGEELFAAGAYLTKDPRLLGSLKGQDIAKALAAVLMLVGIVLETFGYHWLRAFLTIE